jgi:hypothetical protein
MLHIQTGSSVDNIYATYDGDKTKGVILDESNKGIHGLLSLRTL